MSYRKEAVRGYVAVVPLSAGQTHVVAVCHTHGSDVASELDRHRRTGELFGDRYLVRTGKTWLAHFLASFQVVRKVTNLAYINEFFFFTFADHGNMEPARKWRLLITGQINHGPVREEVNFQSFQALRHPGRLRKAAPAEGRKRAHPPPPKAVKAEPATERDNCLLERKNCLPPDLQQRVLDAWESSLRIAESLTCP